LEGAFSDALSGVDDGPRRGAVRVAQRRRPSGLAFVENYLTDPARPLHLNFVFIQNRYGPFLRVPLFVSSLVPANAQNFSSTWRRNRRHRLRSAYWPLVPPAAQGLVTL